MSRSIITRWLCRGLAGAVISAGLLVAAPEPAQAQAAQHPWKHRGYAWNHRGYVAKNPGYAWRHRGYAWHQTKRGWNHRGYAWNHRGWVRNNR